jgi:hypothetical protein
MDKTFIFQILKKSLSNSGTSYGLPPYPYGRVTGDTTHLESQTTIEVSHLMLKLVDFIYH